MDRLYRIYAISSILLLIVLVLSPLKDHLKAWRRIQRENNRMLRDLPQRENPIPVGLKQIWVRDIDRIDRCITCHLGMKNRQLARAPLPHRTHSKMYHDVEEFGCTLCHGGQGLATEVFDAHRFSESWEEPVLPKRYVESTCGRCHIDEDLKETPVLNLGRERIHELKCMACHNRPGAQAVITPSLDGIGSKVKDREWIVRWLKNPKALRPHTRMPNFFLTDEERKNLYDFLMQFTAFPDDVTLEPLPRIYRQRKDDDDFIASGKTLFRESPCTSCHALEGQGGQLATDLDEVATKALETWIYNFLKNPQRFQPDVEMPQFGFSNQDIASITAYMASEFVDWDRPEEKAAAESSPYTPENGQALFYQYNCVGCHQLSGMDTVQNRGPDHTNIGSKKIYQIWFEETDIPLTLHDYIDTKLKTPRVFGETMRMPEYNLTREDRQAITCLLLSFRDETLPIQFIRRGPSPSVWNPQGAMGDIVQTYSCLKCHPIKGDGGDVAPDLSIAGSRLKPDWVGRFLREPVSRRPLIEERMLYLELTENEIQTIVDYFGSVLLDDGLTVPVAWRPSREARERGRRLYWETIGCQGCHMIDGQGGYVGPPLDDVGNRLQPGWMLHWLLDPQEYIPDTIEPKSGMTMPEAWMSWRI